MLEQKTERNFYNRYLGDGLHTLNKIYYPEFPLGTSICVIRTLTLDI
jgi:hypothetical protein